MPHKLQRYLLVYFVQRKWSVSQKLRNKNALYFLPFLMLIEEGGRRREGGRTTLFKTIIQIQLALFGAGHVFLLSKMEISIRPCRQGLPGFRPDVTLDPSLRLSGFPKIDKLLTRWSSKSQGAPPDTRLLSVWPEAAGSTYGNIQT